VSRMSGRGRDGERRLARLYRSLTPEDQSALQAFAEFLVARRAAQPQETQGPLEPDLIPRPPKESVVGAIKRLSSSYFMLDRGAMLNDTSSLMGAHVLQGRPASEVIDDLEALFVRQYARYREEQEPQDV
jgi:hypothetical protein